MRPSSASVCSSSRYPALGETQEDDTPSTPSLGPTAVVAACSSPSSFGLIRESLYPEGGAAEQAAETVPEYRKDKAGIPRDLPRKLDVRNHLFGQKLGKSSGRKWHPENHGTLGTVFQEETVGLELGVMGLSTAKSKR